MIEAAIRVRDKLRHGLIPAVPVPFNADGSVNWEAQQAYTAYMSGQPIAGVAVWAHTGRGLYLSLKDRERVLQSWREALPDKIIIAGAGGARDAESDAEYVLSAVNMAHHVRALGADALLAYAPTRFANGEDRDALVLAYHEQLAAAELPIMLFYLYEGAGGISYPPELLSQLLALEYVFGIKMATLDSVMTYQDVSTLMKQHPEHLFVTGEDRFLGYSLMRGAQAALIGMGSTLTKIQNEMLQAFFESDYAKFIRLSEVIDSIAESTFIAPMEGYIGRMLYILAKLGVIPFEAAHDPWGPSLHQDELTQIDTMLLALSEHAK